MPVPAEIKKQKEMQNFSDLMRSVARTQDRQAFIQLYDHFAPRVKSYLMKGGLDDGLADELMQETMMTVWQKAESFDGAKAAVSTWIFTIARNKKIDRLRKNRGGYHFDLMDPIALALESDEVNADDAVHTIQVETHLSQAVETLSEDQIEIIQKAFYEDKSHGDIAEELNLPLGTVKSRIRLGLKKMRVVLKENGFKNDSNT